MIAYYAQSFDCRYLLLVSAIYYPKHADEVSSVTETRPCSWLAGDNKRKTEHCLGNVVPVDTNRSRSRYRHDTDGILTAFCGWSALFRQLPAAVLSWLAAELNTALRTTTQNPARRANGSRRPGPEQPTRIALLALMCPRAMADAAGGRLRPPGPPALPTAVGPAQAPPGLRRIRPSHYHQQPREGRGGCGWYLIAPKWGPPPAAPLVVRTHVPINSRDV